MVMLGLLCTLHTKRILFGCEDEGSSLRYNQDVVPPCAFVQKERDIYVPKMLNYYFCVLFLP